MPVKICGLRSDPLECANDPECSVNPKCLEPCSEAECPISLSEMQKDHIVRLDTNGSVRCYDACHLDHSLRYVNRTDPMSREPLSAAQHAFVEHVARNVDANCAIAPMIDDAIPAETAVVHILVDSVLSMFNGVADEERHHRPPGLPSRELLILSFMAYATEVGPYRTYLSEDVLHLTLTEHDIDTIFMLVMRATDYNRNRNTLYGNYMRNVLYPTCLSRANRRVYSQMRRTISVFCSHPAVNERLRSWVRTQRGVFLEYMSYLHDAYSMFVRPDADDDLYACLMAVSENLIVMLQQRHEIPRMRLNEEYSIDEILDDIISIHR